MTVDSAVPIRDPSVINMLVISEDGKALPFAQAFENHANVRYYQGDSGQIPYLMPHDSAVIAIATWRPYVEQSSIIVVDGMSYMGKLTADFNLTNTTIFYMVDTQAIEELTRLIHWLNPITISALRDGIENIDIDPELVNVGPVNVSSKRTWKDRLLRRNRG